MRGSLLAEKMVDCDCVNLLNMAKRIILIIFIAEEVSYVFGWIEMDGSSGRILWEYAIFGTGCIYNWMIG